MLLALAYLLSVAVGLVVLAVALRSRPTRVPPNPPALSPALPLAVDGGAEIRVILAAAHQLAARLDTAA